MTSDTHGITTLGTGLVTGAVRGDSPVDLPATVELGGWDESGLILCIYPGGFRKHHEAASLDALLVKVKAQIRARHGLEDIEFTALPGTLEAGGIITFDSGED